MKHSATRRRTIGRTRDAGFEIGVRQTFSAAPDQAWAALTSAEGIKLWLGDVTDLRLETGETYRTHDGTAGEFRVVNPGGHLRLTWQPTDWGTASTLQVRVIPRGAKTVISFHQEQLRGEAEREQMHQRWLAVLAKLRSRLE